MERRFEEGEIIQHFKRELVDLTKDEATKYLYRVVGIARHSETMEEMMVYQALYGDKGLFVRPLSMFESKVDREKYPDIKQVYRFEKYK